MDDTINYPGPKMQKKKVLFICNDNSIRSQLAAAFLNNYFGDRYEAYSAGVEPRQIGPITVKALKEIGVDISPCAKGVNDFKGDKFDCIITLCDYAKAFSGSFPEHGKHLHKNFKDYCVPACCQDVKKLRVCFPEFFKHSKDEADAVSIFRSLKEDIFEWIEKEAVF